MKTKLKEIPRPAPLTMLNDSSAHAIVRKSWSFCLPSILYIEYVIKPILVLVEVTPLIVQTKRHFVDKLFATEGIWILQCFISLSSYCYQFYIYKCDLDSIY
jgi:hypothetical protein